MLFVNGLSALTRIALPIVTLLESICAPLIIFLAVFHSKKMHRYRFLIINNVIWSCLFNWTVWFADPAFLFPAACLVLYNPLVHRVPVAKGVSSFMIFCLVNVELAVVWSLLYRYFMSFPGKLSDFVEKGRLCWICVVSIHAAFYGVAFLPFYFHPIRSSVDQSIEKVRLLDQLPHFNDIEPEIGYICAPNVKLVSKWTFAAFITMILWFIVGMIIFSTMFYRIMVVFQQTNMMSSTQQMHVILFKLEMEAFCYIFGHFTDAKFYVFCHWIITVQAVSVQLFVGYIFLLFPTAALLLTIALRWDEGTTIAAFCIMLVQAHGCVDFVTMIYFITPYRRKLLEILGHNYRKAKLRGSTTLVQTTV
ncbi:unnamed protein product [Bursaphelenchus xylophilus]|uniref:(pine wood nematode) hypothetical protein n=1 Tax=Bursaphelenchus xylophilus TaxID=6326 RepID=A0A1I7RUN8_BURXY|nr:unnamed protein product [Bursaphelenchus xylophilus]CAG9114272.1 unnamed protein product [Bursaphelenchus xylophilus]